MAIALSLARLNEIGAKVAKPSYHRAELSPGIIHVGVGNFHRAHQAMYLHRLFEMGVDHDWAIMGAGVMPFDDSMRRKLQPQDWLTTVVELDPNNPTATICAAMIDFIEVDSQALIEAMSQPEIRIVSMTVTEGGYFVDAKTGGFDRSHPDMATDIAHPDSPNTVFGMIIAALMQRRAAGIPAFTVMSCDNLPENGDVARRTVLGLAKCGSADSHDWIAQNVAFPNSMVDCITPMTGDHERDLVRNMFGINDAAPVVREPFQQWVIEDHFTNGRPALENVGVQFVADVAPYELIKLRILNGGHAAIAYSSGLLGIEYVHEAMRHPLITGFIKKLIHDEIIPTIPEVPGFSLDAYYEKTVERFSNPAIGDRIQRLCFDGSNRQSKFILPALKARLLANQPVDGLALVSALWCRYCYGVSDKGEQIPANDPHWDSLTVHAKAAKEEPRIWLEMSGIYGPLATNEVFVNAFSQALNTLWREGTAATFDAYNSTLA